MTTTRYFARCTAGHTTVLDLAPGENSNPANLFCECGRARMRMAALQARVTEHVCGAKCTSALGPRCDCECGGRNHGIDHRTVAA